MKSYQKPFCELRIFYKDVITTSSGTNDVNQPDPFSLGGEDVGKSVDGEI